MSPGDLADDRKKKERRGGLYRAFFSSIRVIVLIYISNMLIPTLSPERSAPDSHARTSSIAACVPIVADFVYLSRI